MKLFYFQNTSILEYREYFIVAPSVEDARRFIVDKMCSHSKDSNYCEWFEKAIASVNPREVDVGEMFGIGIYDGALSETAPVIHADLRWGREQSDKTLIKIVEGMTP